MNRLYHKREKFNRHTIDPLDFYRTELLEFTPARVSGGWTNAGLCVFHKDTRKGNFRINIHTGAFKCFSCGASGGGVVDFAMLRYSLSFQDAVHLVRVQTGGVV